MTEPNHPETDFTPRQREVLDAVLQLIVREGDSFSVARVAREASCSKETLYKWFGDRDGLLTATVRWQASQVTAGEYDGLPLDMVRLQAALEDFAANWLSVISSPTSLALNRVAVSHAGSGKSRLGKILLANGREAVADRLKALLQAGQKSGLLNIVDTEDAFRTFLGLVGRDLQIRLLLGEGPAPDSAANKARAARAAEQFLALFANEGGGKIHPGKAVQTPPSGQLELAIKS
ncbi:TetR/AcrR family transcriptional regulator [Notoacmeibacter ruber]|uniref:TetR/AcrR family transcriptional regulator n=2 Tax=Notoacmeibacter ruber TaxID=2670375 RepID=A0A3L7JLT5_9HYPH|nr:TetR/AcrR family transcriptional regulator C-terminal domain-containing protein [Notoacmeibacter ruber]RLQ89492.1 TetR/AcrR family transcriptional regulator [Notoacmeibacter ruber]